MSLVIKALESLYSPNSSKEAQEQANQFLEKWQNTTDAWKVSLDMLTTSALSSEFRLFAAQTLRKKISLDLGQIEPAFYLHLRDSLLLQLQQSHAQQRPLAHPILIQACLCLVHLAIHLDHATWPNPIQHICHYLGSSPQASVLFEFLSLFPEEAQTAAYTSGSKNRAVKLIEENLAHIFELLHAPLSQSTSEKQVEICKCLLNWIKYCSHIPLELFQQHPAVQYAFQCLVGTDACDIASELLCEIVYQSYRYHWAPILPLLISGLATALPTLGLWVKEDEADLVRAVTFVYVDFAEYYIHPMLEAVLAPHPSPYAHVMEGVLMAAEYADFKVVELTFKVWTAVSDYYRDLAEDQDKNRLRQALQAIMTRLMAALISHLKYPQSYAHWTSQRHDDFRDFRHVIGDCMKDCVDILGTQPVLSLLTGRLESLAASVVSGGVSAASSLWPEFEALFTALRMIAICVNNDESAHIATVMRFLSALYSLPNRELQYAIILFISSYAPWTACHAEYIPWQMEILGSSLIHSDKPEPEQSLIKGKNFSGACLALRNLCKYGAKHMISHGDLVALVYQKYEVSGSSTDLDSVFFALSCLISHMPAAQASHYAHALVADLLQKISSLIHSSHAMQDRDQGRLLCNLLTRYAILIEALERLSPHPMLGAFTESFLAFNTIYDRFGANTAVLESLGKLLKAGMVHFSKEAGPQLATSLSGLLKHGYQRTRSASAVYAARMFVKEFSTGATLALAIDLATAFHNMILASPPSSPDVIEDYAFLILTSLDFIPESLLSSVSLVEKVVAYMIEYYKLPSLQNPTTVGITLGLLNDIYCAVLDPNQPPAVRTSLYPALMGPLGAELTAVVLHSAIGTFAPSTMHDCSLLLRTLHQADPNHASPSSRLPSLLQQYLSGLPESSFPSWEKEQLQSTIPIVLGGEKPFAKFLRHLGRTCRRRLD